MIHVVAHLFVDLVNPAADRFGQPAAADDGVEVEGHAKAVEFVYHDVAPESVLVHYMFKLRQFLYRMADVAQEYGLFVVVDGYFGRSGAWVDN